MALKDKYCTISEAAEEVGVTRQTVSRWIKDGKLPVEKIGRETLIEKKVIHKYAEFQRKLPFIKWAAKEAMIALRKKYGYTGEDKMRIKDFETEGKDGIFMFDVIHKDGVTESANVRAIIEVRMDPKIQGPALSFVTKEVWKPETGQAIRKTGHTRKGVKSKR
jgi:excisionase family DNA binding protein